VHQLIRIWEGAAKISMLGIKKNCNPEYMAEFRAKKEGHKKNLGPL
jgi:hypothetical protein